MLYSIVLGDINTIRHTGKHTLCFSSELSKAKANFVKRTI